MVQKYKLDPNPPITPSDLVADPPYVMPADPVRPGPFPVVTHSTRYNYASIKNPVVHFPSDDPKSRSITNQSDKDGTDINLMMARYEKSGLITDLITGEQRKPFYGDFTVTGDYFTMQTQIARATEAFNALPASTKNRFQNDPKVLVDFLADSANDPEAVKLGLKTAPDGPSESPILTSQAPAAPVSGPPVTAA